MKLAFISDIHANLPALKAVLADIEKQPPDDIYCLGDLVNFAGWDNEVIDLIKQNDITCLQGNHDEAVGYNRNSFSFSFNSPAQERFGHLSIQYVNKTISDSNRQYLANLPFMLQLQFRFPFRPLQLAMVHGSPESVNEYLDKDTSDEYLLELMDSVNTDILLMGHTHIPYHKSIYSEDENRKIYRHAINVGSVGKPKHGNLDACYCLLEINQSLDLSDSASVNVHFKYVGYNTEEVRSRIKDIGLPNAYDDYLSGKNG